jgi:hypothetical protein
MKTLNLRWTGYIVFKDGDKNCIQNFDVETSYKVSTWKICPYEFGSTAYANHDLHLFCRVAENKYSDSEFGEGKSACQLVGRGHGAKNLTYQKPTKPHLKV